MCGNCKTTQLTKGEKGDNGVTAFKFVKKITSSGDGETITVTRDEITACGSTPIGCIGTGTTSNGFIDLHIQLQLYTFPSWTNQPLGVIYSSCSTGKGVDATIDVLNGDLYLTFNYPISEGADEYRLVILA